MARAYRFVQPMRFTGSYPSNWAGYYYKETLGYTSGRHTGVDYNFGAGNADLGFPVSAIANGVVCNVTTAPGFGKTVIIKHTLDDRLKKKYGTTYLYSRYMHLQNFKTGIKKGTVVKVGGLIGTCGNSGTHWAHLHLDLWKGNLGCHMSYHKDSALSSYLDPYRTIEANKNNKEGDVATRLNDTLTTREYQVNRGKNPTAGEKAHWRNKTLDSLSFAFKRETDAARKQSTDRAKALAASRKTIADLQKQIQQGKVKMVDVSAQLAKAEQEIKDHEAKDAVQQEAIDQLEKQNTELKEGISGFFDKLIEKLTSWVNKE